MFVTSGRGNEMASGVCPVGSTCGSFTAGVNKFSGTSCLDCDGFLLGALGLGASWGGWCEGWESRRGVGVFGTWGSGMDVERGGGAVLHMCAGHLH